MALLTRPVQTYRVGTYGPFQLTDLPAGTKLLRLRLGNTAAWPAAEPLLSIWMQWDNSAEQGWTIPSPPLLRTGTLAPEAIFETDVPIGLDGLPKNVAWGQARFQVFKAFACNVILETE